LPCGTSLTRDIVLPFYVSSRRFGAKGEAPLSACSAHSAGVMHSDKINHLICITLLQAETRKRNFWKKLEKALMAAS
jgi:hypothetical protein